MIEKTEPMIDKPVPLNNCLSVVIIPSLRLGIESNTEPESAIEDGVDEITAEMENPKITRQRIVMKVATDAIKYFCCFGITNFFFVICFINVSVNPALTSFTFKSNIFS